MTLTLSLTLKVRLFRALIAALRWMPLKARSALGLVLGFTFSFIPTRDRKIAALQLRRFHPRYAHTRTIAGVYAHVGQNALESIELGPILENPERYITAHGIEAGHAIMNEGRGIVTLTAHVGNWDLLAAYVITRGFTLYTAGREARNPALQDLLAELRDKYQIKMLWRSDASVQRHITNALKERAIVAALIDQDTRVSGTFAPFFGTPAFTPTRLIDIGKSCNAAIVSAFIIRTSFMKFEVIVKQFDDSLSAEEIAAEFNSRLENILQQYPSQWVWFHKRWRTRPNGKRLSSREYMSRLQSGALDNE